MSIEVEIKLKIKNKKQVIDSLKTIGFLEGRYVVETDTYYTSSHHDFAARGEALRIRKVEDLKSGKETCLITYKGAKLEQIGFCPVSPVEKQRLYLRKDNMTACLDEVKGLGNYLELEILTDAEEERTKALKQIENVLEILGYSMKDTTRTSYLSMLKKKDKDGSNA